MGKNQAQIKIKPHSLNLSVVCLLYFFTILAQITQALPPPEDIPEEILRTEIILYGRSPIDGKPLNASEYVKIQEEIAQSAFSSDIDPKIKELIFFLQLRKLFKTITPF